MHRLSCGLRHHQRVEYLDGPHDGYGRSKESICAGRQRAHTGTPHDNGGNARRGSQEPCRNVPPLLLYPCSRRQVHPLHDGESDVLSGRNGLGTVQYAQGERFLFQHLGNECRLFDFLRQYHLQQGEDGVHLLRAAAYRTAQQYPDARTGYGGTAQACTPDGEQPARAAHCELAHTAEQGHRAKDKKQLLTLPVL